MQEILDSLQSLGWGEHKDVETIQGHKTVRNAEIPKGHSFWNHWKLHSSALKQAGFNLSKFGIKWYIAQWTPFGEKTSFKEVLTHNMQWFDEEVSQEPPNPPLTERQETRLEGIRGKLLPYQFDAVRAIAEAVNTHKGCLDSSDTGTGKCHPKGTLIRMFNGSLKSVEKIKPGDLLMGDDSRPRAILSISNGIGDLYEVQPQWAGENWGCNGDHILVLKNTRSKETVELTARDYIHKATSSTRFKHEWKLFRVGVEYAQKPVSIPPYFIGLWIGDGTWCQPCITVADVDHEIASYLESVALEFGLRLYKAKKLGAACQQIFLRGLNRRGGKNSLWSEMLKMGLGKKKIKSIPREYLHNDSSVRKDLLAGIVDSDGSKCEEGCYEISCRDSSLKEDVLEIARSLGYSAVAKQKRVKAFGVDKLYWRIHISGAHDLPVLLKRKMSISRIKPLGVSTAFSIKPLGVGKYYGFTLDGNHRYLLKDFTVTHNTYVSLAAIFVLQKVPAILCPKSVIPAWRRACAHFGMTALFITNYEQAKTRKFQFGHFVTERGHKKFLWELPIDAILIFDEVQRCKSRTTFNSKLLIGSKDAYIPTICLSATAAVSPVEMYALGYALGLHNGKEFYKWMQGYGTVKTRFGMSFLGGNTALKRLHSKIFPLRGNRIRISDLGDAFPETQISAEPFDTGNAAKISEVYAQMYRELTKLKEQMDMDARTMRANMLVIMLRARQKAELLKVPAFCELAEDGKANGMHIAIFVNFTETLKAICERLKTKCVIHGQQTGDEREKNIQMFQADKSPYIVCQIQSGGVGISLHGESRLALISPTWSAVDIKQALGRVHRAGGGKSIQKVVYAADTIEERVCEKVRDKLAALATLNDGDLTPADIF